MKDNFLLYIPKKSKKVNWEKKQEKIVFLFYHDRLIEKVARLFVKKPRVTTLELDDIGTAVWELIDGEKNVYEIGQELKERFGEKVEPLYERLSLFLGYLNKRGWIYFSKKGDTKE
ncbi:PqqD family protein [Caldanaerobacter sp.]|uniref:PqqD family protein n=1 Tax=Caldanaerobacter sp. TaxID=2930036 RepID=UPI003C758E57